MYFHTLLNLALGLILELTTYSDPPAMLLRLIGSMSPWVLTLGTSGIPKRTLVLSDMPDRTLFTLHRTLTVPVPSTTYVAIFEIHMYRPPSFISL